MSIVLLGSTSGSCTLQEQAVAGTTTLTLPTFNGTVGLLVSGTAVVTTSGTNIDFTGIPAGVRRITVMYSGVSTNGTNGILVQLGTSGGVANTGYSSYGTQLTASAVAGGAQTTGFAVTFTTAVAANILSGLSTICNVSGNIWAFNSTASYTDRNQIGGGAVALSGTLDRIRITTAGGTDTFDAGTINILYE
jgi:hypothetical protein